MTVKTIKVKQGECMSSYAKKYGFHDPDVIYSHPANSALKTERKNPHILKKGDVVKIPDRNMMTEEAKRLLLEIGRNAIGQIKLEPSLEEKVEAEVKSLEQ